MVRPRMAGHQAHSRSTIGTTAIAVESGQRWSLGHFQHSRPFLQFPRAHGRYHRGFLDVRNITRDDGLNVSRETFGGADDLETTWNIARECDALNLKGTTIASMAMSDYIGGDYAGFKRHFPPLDKAEYHRMRPAYYGAIVYSRPGEYRDCRSWDANSLYPSIMRDFAMPVGSPVCYEGEYHYDADYPLHIDVISFDARLKREKRRHSQTSYPYGGTRANGWTVRWASSLCR